MADVIIYQTLSKLDICLNTALFKHRNVLSVIDVVLEGLILILNVNKLFVVNQLDRITLKPL